MIAVDASERPDGAARPSPLAARFAQFASRDCRGCSPLYDFLGGRIARDAEILALAGKSGAAHPPALLFAAVQFLLLQRPEDPLAAWYASIAERPADPRQAWPAFRRFCLAQADAIAGIMASRQVSTNEVGRGAVLRPANATVAPNLRRGPLHVVEIGTAAGLNLLWDKARVFYEPAGSAGPEGDALHLACRLIGDGRPPLDLGDVTVASRTGIDLQPLDGGSAEDRRWLDALVWPEHRARRQRLAAALDRAVSARLPILAGDGTGPVLGRALDALPLGEAVCVFHSFALGQLDDDAQSRLDDGLESAARSRPVFRIGLEWESASAPVLRWRPYGQGRVGAASLALADPHGAWLEWLAADAV